MATKTGLWYALTKISSHPVVHESFNTDMTYGGGGGGGRQ